MYNRTEHAKEIAQSLIDSFLVAQFGVGDMKAHRLLAIESGIVAVDFFLNKSRKGDDYDYGLYEQCRSQLIVLRQGCL
jgi:hypothetical protein